MSLCVIFQWYTACNLHRALCCRISYNFYNIIGVNYKTSLFKPFRYDINGYMKPTWSHQVIAKIHFKNEMPFLPEQKAGHDAWEYCLLVIQFWSLRERNEEEKKERMNEWVILKTELMFMFTIFGTASVHCIRKMHINRHDDKNPKSVWLFCSNLLLLAHHLIIVYTHNGSAQCTTFKLETAYLSHRSVPLP